MQTLGMQSVSSLFGSLATHEPTPESGSDMGSEDGVLPPSPAFSSDEASADEAARSPSPSHLP